MIFQLFKIFASNLFSFETITEGFKKGVKGIVKSILLILLFLYVIGWFASLYVMTMLALYKVLENIGQVHLMPVISFLAVMVMIFFFGLTSVSTNYYTNSGEEQFLVMPISSTTFFGAKFAVSFVTDAVLGILLFGISNVIYAKSVGLLANPLFYVGMIVSAVCLSLVTVFLIYILYIIPLYFIPALRKRNLMTSIAVVFILIFSIFYGLFGSLIGTQNYLDNVNQISQPMMNISAALSQKFTFLLFISDAINGKILPILFMLLISVIIVFVLVPAAGHIYIKTLHGFSDIKTKKVSNEKTNAAFQNGFRSNSVFKALFIRDVRIVFREPSFFANGPLMVFLFPVIIIISFGLGFVSSMENPSTELPMVLMDLKDKILSIDSIFLKYCVSMGGAVFTIFLGNMSSIAITSFSREGKALFDLKAMPIKNEILVKVKFWHALLYIIISEIIAIIFITVLNLICNSPLTFFDMISIIFYMTLIVFSVSIVLVLCDMFMDTANPKLLWENPVVAFKQNLNTLAGVLFNVIFIAILIGLAFFIVPKNQFGQIIITLVFVIISAPLGVQYFNYAKKRIPLM